MAVSAVAASEVQLLVERESGVVVEGVVDYKGGKVIDKSKTGGWRSASLIIGVEIAERFAYFGIASNLITYLTGPLRQSTATAAQNVNFWSGVASMLPLLGAFVADSYLGRFRTILFSSILYLLGLGMLTLSAVQNSLNPIECKNTENNNTCSPSPLQIMLFFSSLYLVAIALGGHKPCVQAFGADQFDGQDQEECKSKNSFFNWWFFGLCIGAIISSLMLTYIQDNLNWGLGFGIPCISMAIALVIFLLGVKNYRYYSFKNDKTSPFRRIAQVFVASARNWRVKSTPSSVADVEEEEGSQNTSTRVGAHQFK